MGKLQLFEQFSREFHTLVFSIRLCLSQSGAGPFLQFPPAVRFLRIGNYASGHREPIGTAVYPMGPGGIFPDVLVNPKHLLPPDIISVKQELISIVPVKLHLLRNQLKDILGGRTQHKITKAVAVEYIDVFEPVDPQKKDLSMRTCPALRRIFKSFTGGAVPQEPGHLIHTLILLQIPQYSYYQQCFSRIVTFYFFPSA